MLHTSTRVKSAPRCVQVELLGVGSCVAYSAPSMKDSTVYFRSDRVVTSRVDLFVCQDIKIFPQACEVEVKLRNALPKAMP